MEYNSSLVLLFREIEEPSIIYELDETRGPKSGDGIQKIVIVIFVITIVFNFNHCDLFLDLYQKCTN